MAEREAELFRRHFEQHGSKVSGLDPDEVVDVVHSMLDDVIFEVRIEGAVVDVLFDPRVACGMPDKDAVTAGQRS